jgi:hypothetical protein
MPLGSRSRAHTSPGSSLTKNARPFAGTRSPPAPATAGSENARPRSEEAPTKRRKYQRRDQRTSPHATWPWRPLHRQGQSSMPFSAASVPRLHLLRSRARPPFASRGAGGKIGLRAGHACWWRLTSFDPSATQAHYSNPGRMEKQVRVALQSWADLVCEITGPSQAAGLISQVN